MIEVIIMSSVLISIIMLIRFTLKSRINPRLQYAIWGLVLLRLLLPFSIFSSPVSVMNILPSHVFSDISSFFGAAPREVDPNPSEDDITASTTTGRVGSPFTTNSSLNGYASAAINDSSQVRPDQNLPPFLQTVISFVWAAGTAAISLYLILMNIRFRRKLNKNAVMIQTQECTLPVYKADFLHSPCLVGFMRPRIYITGPSMQDEITLKHIITHELCHYAHRDNWWSLFRGICLAVYWFNPFVWLAAYLSRQDCELACDEAAIIRLGEGSRISYGRTLLSLVVEKAAPADLFRAATTMTSGSRGLKERIRLIAKKPRMTAVIAAVVVLVAVLAVCLTFTHGANTAVAGSNNVEAEAGETQSDSNVSSGDQAKSSMLPAEVEEAVGKLIEQIINSDTVTVEYEIKGSNGQSPSIRTKTLNADERANYKGIFEASNGWDIAKAEDISKDAANDGDRISIYDDEGHSFSSTWGSLIVTYTDGVNTVNYKSWDPVGRGMILTFVTPSVEERQHWDEEMKENAAGPVYADDQDGKDYSAVGTAWAQADIKKYFSLSKDNPCYSDEGSVKKVEVLGYSVTNHPLTVAFRITQSVHPVNGKYGFIQDWMGSDFLNEDGENLLICREIVLENTGDNLWTCKAVNSGGSAGWGYIQMWRTDTESVSMVYDELQKWIEGNKGDYTNMDAVLMDLNMLDWGEYTKLYGSSAANSLMDCIEAKAFGSDQEIRTVYILEGVSGLNDEIKPRYISLLKKLESSDNELFERCIGECDDAYIVQEIMKSL